MFLFSFCLEFSSSSFIPFLSAPKTRSCWFDLSKDLFFFSFLSIYHWFADFSGLRSPIVIEILTILLYQLRIKHCCELIFFWKELFFHLKYVFHFTQSSTKFSKHYCILIEKNSSLFWMSTTHLWIMTVGTKHSFIFVSAKLKETKIMFSQENVKMCPLY